MEWHRPGETAISAPAARTHDAARLRNCRSTASSGSRSRPWEGRPSDERRLPAGKRSAGLGLPLWKTWTVVSPSMTATTSWRPSRSMSPMSRSQAIQDSSRMTCRKSNSVRAAGTNAFACPMIQRTAPSAGRTARTGIRFTEVRCFSLVRPMHLIRCLVSQGHPHVQPPGPILPCRELDKESLVNSGSPLWMTI